MIKSVVLVLFYEWIRFSINFFNHNNYIPYFHLTGFPLSTITVMFVTYCLIQIIKEKERKQALIDDPDPVPPPVPAPPPTTIKPQTEASAAAADPNKKKSE